MKMQGVEAAIKETEARLLAVRSELVEISVERDKLLSEVTAQRAAKNEVRYEKEVLSKNLDTTIRSLASVTDQRMAAYDLFLQSFQRNKDHLSALERAIKEKEQLSLLHTTTSDDLSKASKKVEEAKVSLNEASRELHETKTEAECLRKELLKQENDLADREAAVKVESDRVDAWILSVEKREKELQWKEEMHELTVKEFIKERDGVAAPKKLTKR